MHLLPRHLRQLEAESIAIVREVVAEFRNPVLLYSIGKDSSVLLHIAQKAFFPSKPPFPLLHVDTTWKFREMYAMRDRTAKSSGMQLIVYQNPDALARGINPFDHGYRYGEIQRIMATLHVAHPHAVHEHHDLVVRRAAQRDVGLGRRP